MFILRMKRAGALAALLWAAALAPAGAVPPGFNIQGRLTDANGVNREGNYSIKFTLYDAATGGSSLWTRTYPSLTVRNGNFQTVLGDVAGQPMLADVFASGDSRHLEIQVLSGPGVSSPEVPLVPRQQLVSVPYAMKAAAADASAALAATSTAAVRIADGSQGNGKVLTSDAAGVGSWQSLSIPQRHYAALTIGCSNSGNPTDFVVTNAAFDPPLPPEIAGTNPVPTIEASLVETATSAPGGGASVFGFEQFPGPVFNGTNPKKGVYRNVRINDSIRVLSICNTAAGGGGFATFLFAAVLNK